MQELVDLLVDETAGSLSLLSDFMLAGESPEDEIVHDRPGAADNIRIAFRFGFRNSNGARMGFLQIPLEGALVLAGALLMVPTDTLGRDREKSAPDETQKDAMMEAGTLLAGAFDSVLKGRFQDEIDVEFFGCQGVPAGRAPWVAGYAGEPLVVRKQDASFGSFEPFEMLFAVPS